MSREHPPKKETTTVINQASIAAGDKRDSVVLSLERLCSIRIRITYGALVAAGVRVFVLASDDAAGTNLDTEDVGDAYIYFDPAFGIGTFKRTVNCEITPKYVLIRVRNLDAAQAQGAVVVEVNENYE